ncbi:hypothetical protein A9K55_007083 [Cordyceps militaris]|uniref:Uncharacterized protein n=1 Tax=Cordyceps militaris TaxID=73501 RepID=A0A2H4SJE5_CORMI|nr:hypothetical protein A9K55_007083 [Cordyceps militaris]
MPTLLDNTLKSKNMVLAFGGVVAAATAWMLAGDLFPADPDPKGEPETWTREEMRRWLEAFPSILKAMMTSSSLCQSRTVVFLSRAALNSRHTTAASHLSRTFFASFSMATKAIPVIVCGRREAIGEAVAAGLKPEYERILTLAVVHFVKTPEAGVKDLPLVLEGSAPETVPSSVGTGNIATGATAVILGGGYDDDDYDVMRKAVDAAALKERPVWLRNDLSVVMPPPGPEYGKAIVVRVKKMLAKLEKDKKLDGSDGNVYWY